MRVAGYGIIIVFLLFFAPRQAVARDVTILVQDGDLGLPLEGATVRSWDGREYVCDEDGTVTLTAPDDRQVAVQAAYPGYESGRLALALGARNFTVSLRLSGVIEGRELVIEAARPGASEGQTGRSVAVTERQIAQTGEIGLIEDVMTTIKLLPGVGYSGMFNALPSIRGGEPGDMSASLDGFYVGNPYHWGGGFSIFDPRMVQSAKLSHGVFSTRYGHTVSGLLEVSAKKPSPDITEFEIGANTSAANFNLSLPLARKGGIMFMGRVTYYDPVVQAAKWMAGVFPALSVINSVTTAPYIRSGAITMDYRFFDNLELQSTAFWGMDGVGADYKNASADNGYESKSDMAFNYTNYQGFLTAGLSWNPRSDMLLKTTLGAGYHQANIEGDMQFFVNKRFSDDFNLAYFGLLGLNPLTPYEFSSRTLIDQKTTTVTAQGRVDYDWEVKDGIVFAAGVQEMFSGFSDTGSFTLPLERQFPTLSPADQQVIKASLPGIPDPFYERLFVNYRSAYTTEADNRLFSASAYTLSEYRSPGKRFGAELGLRMDHFLIQGKGFTVSTTPVFNPRLNLDFNVFKDRGILHSFDISAGTGLFSSINDMVAMADERYDLSGGKPGRSWTSVLGTKLDLPGNMSFNIEGYYKYIFDRAYVPVEAGIGEIKPRPHTDGEGRVWGFDLMLQKQQSRYWDGWISYSFNWARYRDPQANSSGVGISGGNRGDDWYFPSYHRFHNLNLILNIKPAPWLNIYTRLGFAGGTQLSKVVGDILSYPVYVYDGSSGYFIEKFKRRTVNDENNRTTPSIPLDIKVSFLGNNNAGRTRYEVYVAVENALALLYTSQGNTSFNQYTGKEDTGSNSASYELPIPIPSFGFKLSY